MKSIPNNYLHFGDFDLAGIGIYVNEYKCHLSNKSSFYIPIFLSSYFLHKKEIFNEKSEALWGAGKTSLLKIKYLQIKGCSSKN